MARTPGAVVPADLLDDSSGVGLGWISSISPLTEARPGSRLSDAFNIGEMQAHALLVAPALPIPLAAAAVR